MKAWLIVASWWAQGALERLRRGHLTTDPACTHHRAPRSGSWLDRASRGLECEPCMVRRAFGYDECRPPMTAAEFSAARPCEPGDKMCVDPYPCAVHDQPKKENRNGV